MAFPQLRRYRAFSGTSEKHRSISCGDILVVMSMAHRLTCKKLRVLSRLRRSQPAPNIRNPAPLRTHWCPCVASSSCLALGKCPQMPERARHLRPLSSLLLTYLPALRFTVSFSVCLTAFLILFLITLFDTYLIII